MKEVIITPLNEDYKNFIEAQIGRPFDIKGQVLIYENNCCHTNSIIFSDFINTKNGVLGCSIIEGMVINDDGFAYGHFWNVLNDDNGNVQYCDITMDAIATPEERDIKKRYYAIKERNVDEMIEKIKDRKILFSDEVLAVIDDYYVHHPEQKGKYDEYRRSLA